MTDKVEDIENAVKCLSPNQLRQFQVWYEEFDAALWDQQIEEDAKNGRLDDLAEAALANYHSEKPRN